MLSNILDVLDQINTINSETSTLTARSSDILNKPYKSATEQDFKLLDQWVRHFRGEAAAKICEMLDTTASHKAIDEVLIDKTHYVQAKLRELQLAVHQAESNITDVAHLLANCETIFLSHMSLSTTENRDTAVALLHETASVLADYHAMLEKKVFFTDVPSISSAAEASDIQLNDVRAEAAEETAETITDEDFAKAIIGGTMTAGEFKVTMRKKAKAKQQVLPASSSQVTKPSPSFKGLHEPSDAELKTYQTAFGPRSIAVGYIASDDQYVPYFKQPDGKKGKRVPKGTKFKKEDVVYELGRERVFLDIRSCSSDVAKVFVGSWMPSYALEALSSLNLFDETKDEFPKGLTSEEAFQKLSADTIRTAILWNHWAKIEANMKRAGWDAKVPLVNRLLTEISRCPNVDYTIPAEKLDFVIKREANKPVAERCINKVLYSFQTGMLSTWKAGEFRDEYLNRAAKPLSFWWEVYADAFKVEWLKLEQNQIKQRPAKLTLSGDLRKKFDAAAKISAAKMAKIAAQASKKLDQLSEKAVASEILPEEDPDIALSKWQRFKLWARRQAQLKAIAINQSASQSSGWRDESGYISLTEMYRSTRNATFQRITGRLAQMSDMFKNTVDSEGKTVPTFAATMIGVPLAAITGSATAAIANLGRNAWNLGSFVADSFSSTKRLTQRWQGWGVLKAAFVGAVVFVAPLSAPAWVYGMAVAKVAAVLTGMDFLKDLFKSAVKEFKATVSRPKGATSSDKGKGLAPTDIYIGSDNAKGHEAEILDICLGKQAALYGTFVNSDGSFTENIWVSADVECTDGQEYVMEPTGTKSIATVVLPLKAKYRHTAPAPVECFYYGGMQVSSTLYCSATLPSRTCVKIEV